MSFENIILERTGYIGKITFNRPKVLNAYSKALATELTEALKELEKDDAVRVIVITGAGRAFMAGADINMVNDWSSSGSVEKVKEALDEMFNPNMMEEMPKPIIAAVNGFAFGMGCEIAMGCDFRIAAESAQFGQPEIKIGIIPGGGGTQRLFHLIGGTKAMEMLTTGDPITAQEAHRIGLVNKIVPDDKLWDAVEALASRLVDKSPIALDYIKKCIYVGGEMPIRKGLDYEVDLFCKILITEDAKEGTKAFLEKRKPQYKGK